MKMLENKEADKIPSTDFYIELYRRVKNSYKIITKISMLF